MWLSLYGERDASFALGEVGQKAALTEEVGGNLDALVARLADALRGKTLAGVAAFGGPGRLTLVRGLLSYAAGLGRGKNIPAYGFTAKDLLLADWVKGADKLVFEPVRGTVLAYVRTKDGKVRRQTLHPPLSTKAFATGRLAMSPAAQAHLPDGVHLLPWPDQPAARILEVLPALLSLPSKNRYPTTTIEYARPAV